MPDPWAVISQTPATDQTPDDGWNVVSQAPVPKSVGGFLGNVVSSGANLLGNAISTIHGAAEAPVRAAVNWTRSPENQIPPTEEEQQFSNIGDTIAGLTHQGFKKIGLGSTADETPEAQADIAKAEALENQYKQRYGGLRNIGNTLYSDPVGALADAAMLTGGVAGAAGKTGELAEAANMGRTANALRTASRAAKTATEYNPVVSVPTKVIPAAYQGAKTAITDIRDRVADPHTTMIQALRPTASRTTFDRSVATAMPDIKAVESVPGNIKDVGSLLDHIKVAKQVNRAEFQRYTTPAEQMNMQVDINPVADAMAASVPDTVRFENAPGGVPAGAYREALDQADLYRTRVPVEQAENFLRDINAQLDAYYAKYPGVKYAQLRANPETASLVAKADAMRDALYKALDEPGMGAGPRDINRRYGALIDLEDAALRRKNVAARQAPQNLSQQFSNVHTAMNVVRGGAKVFGGNLLGAGSELAQGAAIRNAAKWLKDQQSTNNLIRRAFKYYDITQEFPFHPPPRPVAGLLPGASFRMGPGPDTSFVHGVSGPESAVLGFPQSQQKLLPDVSNPIGGQMRKPWTESGGMPQNAGQPIGGGVVVPDVLGRSLRGQGTPRPLLPAAPGTPTGGVTQPTRFGRPGYRGQPGRNPQQSTVSGPGAKTVGPPAAIPLPPAGTFKNPYR